MIFYTISKILNMKYCNLSYEMIFFFEIQFLKYRIHNEISIQDMY